MSEQNEKQTWERKALERVAMATVAEQRSARRWRFFGRVLVILAIFAYVPFISVWVPKMVSQTASGNMSLSKGGEHIGIVDVYGPIAKETVASAGYIGEGLRRAMENDNTIAVFLRINSPGGSPVQSDLVYQEILRMRNLHPEKPVYAIIEDIGASGAYYIASAAEKIFASPSSIVGSIGVTSGGSFGFVDALEKLGVERRVYTSGNNKAFLDPFLPEKPEDKARYEAMLKNVHKQFIEAVENQRATKIKNSDEIFSGYVWTGEESKELGLIDEFGSARSIAREEFDTDEFGFYTIEQDFFTRFADRLGASAARTFVEILTPAPSFE